MIPMTRRAAVVDACVEAAGPLFAGKKRVGSATVVLAYCLGIPTPAARVWTPSSGKRAVRVHVLREDLVNVYLLQDRLEQVSEEEWND